MLRSSRFFLSSSPPNFSAKRGSLLSGLVSMSRSPSVLSDPPRRPRHEIQQLQQSQVKPEKMPAPVSSSKSQPKPRFSFSPEITLTGRVFVADEITGRIKNYHSNINSNNALQHLNTGDVRLRRHYFAQAADEDFFTPREEDDNDDMSDPAERFSDRGPPQRAIRVSNARSNIYELEGRDFKSMTDLGSRYHRLDGHEMVNMQAAARQIARFSAGIVLVDVRFQGEGNQQRGHWIELSGVSAAIGRPRLNFKDGDSALTMTQMVSNFFSAAKGEPVHLRRTGSRKLRYEIRLSKNKTPLSHFTHMHVNRDPTAL